MGYMAAKAALSCAELEPEDIGLVIGTTCTPDYYTPSMAAIVQRSLGAENAFAFDVNVACSGFAFAVDLARQYLANGVAGRALIVSAEGLSQYIDYTDRSMCVLFGDGAGAVVVEGAEGIYGSYQHNDISGTEYVYGKRPRRDTPFGKAVQAGEHEPFPAATLDNITMNGREVYKFATKAMPRAVEDACRAAGIAVNELDMIFPHQANLRIIQAAVKNMDIDMERIYVNIHNYGNMSSATIPIGLSECIAEGKIKRGDKICFVGFGAGLQSAATVFEY
jgi:3-oxoacyl-[acyl-carrier-protein] synthase-3